MPKIQRSGERRGIDPKTAELIPHIYETIDDIEKWHVVIEKIAKLSGATKGLISLRNSDTAELMFPANLSETGQSPFIFGFAKEFIKSYIAKYHKCDVWVPIERVRRPQLPYALSDYLDKKKLMASEFWNWLEPQGIGDAVVLELARHSKHWVGLCFGLGINDAGEKKRLLEVVSDLRLHLKRAWRLGEVFREAETLLGQHKAFLEKYEYSAVILRNDLSILEMNERAQEYFASNLDACTIKNKRISISDRVFRDQFEHAISDLSKDHSGRPNSAAAVVDSTNYQWTISLMGHGENALGVDANTYFICIVPRRLITAVNGLPIWEHPDLTTRERQLVRHLADGETVISFARLTGLTKHGADYHWRNVKRKLGIATPREIYYPQKTIHR